MQTFNTSCFYLKNYSDLPIDDKNYVVFYDKAVKKNNPELFLKLNKSVAQFELIAGESLKSLNQFNYWLKVIDETLSEIYPLTFVAIGGGSIGDFVGFLASVYRRGVNLVHIPSTWLAAIDSSHGGKTALNINQSKNQIGSFYPAEKVIIFKPLLTSLPEKLINESLSELLKMYIIDNQQWDIKWQQFHGFINQPKQKKINLLWKLLPLAVTAKYKIVLKDPFEKKGLRQKLNLGHTLGHVLESTHKISHAQSVAYGLVLALEFSYLQKKISKQYFEKWNHYFKKIGDPFLLSKMRKKINHSEFLNHLKKDKKRRDSTVDFVFFKNSSGVKIEAVEIEHLMNFLIDKGLVRK